jgi:hypothetical protein
MILGTDNRDRWSKWDILLAQAYQILEDERCPQCGLPRYICQNDDRDIDFRVETEQCAAMEKKESFEQREQEKRDKKKGRNGESPKAPSGVIVKPQPYTYSGVGLHTFRDSYYEREAQKRAEVDAARAAELEALRAAESA